MSGLAGLLTYLGSVHRILRMCLEFIYAMTRRLYPGQRMAKAPGESEVEQEEYL